MGKLKVDHDPAEVTVKDDTELKQESVTLVKAAISSTFLYVIVFSQGLAQLFSSNAIMNSSHFFMSRVSSTGHGYLVMDYVLVILCSAKFFFLILSSFLFQYLTPFHAVLTAQTGKSIIFCILGLLAWLKSVSSDSFLALLLSLAFLGSIFGVMSFLGIFHILARLKPKFSQALCTGQSSAGIITSLLKILTILWAPADADTGVMIYFFTTACVILVSTFLFLFLKRMHDGHAPMLSFSEKQGQECERGQVEIQMESQTRTQAQAQAQAPAQTRTSESMRSSLPLEPIVEPESEASSSMFNQASVYEIETSRSVSPTRKPSSPFATSQESRCASTHTLPSVKRRSSVLSESCRIMDQAFCSSPLAFEAPLGNRDPFVLEDSRTKATEPSFQPDRSKGQRLRQALRSYRHVFGRHRLYFVCIFLHYLSSLLIVPNFCYITESTQVRSSGHVLYSREFFPVFTFLLYHVGDWIARFMIGFQRFQLKRRSMIYAGVGGTFVFFPLFLFGNLQFVGLELQGWPRYLASDVFFCCLVTVFGAVNGYLSTALIMLGPQLSSHDKDKQIVSSLVAFSLSLGLLLGAVTSLLFKLVIYSCAL